MRNAIETQRLGGAHRCAPPWSILTWHSYARYIEHRVKRCAYVLLTGNGNGMRAAVKSFEKISEIFGNLASLANFSNRARDGTNPFR